MNESDFKIDWISRRSFDAWLCELLDEEESEITFTTLMHPLYEGWVRPLKKPNDGMVAVLDRDAILAWAAAKQLGGGDAHDDE